MTGDRSTSRLEVLRRHLRENGRRYCPDLPEGDLQIEFEDARDGRLSSVQRVGLRAGAEERHLVLKLPPREAAAGRNGAHRPPRPRVAPLLDPATKFEHERDALRALETHFDALADPRFGCVRVLDFVPDVRALVLSSVPGRPLRELLARRLRPWDSRGKAELEPTFHTAGAWLRAFHALPPLPHTRVRSATRAEFLASVRELADFLAAGPAGARLVSRAAAAAERAALECLPEELPLGIGHGDLAPRNLLIEPRDRITGLDTRAAWLVPIYEDIGSFLVALRTPRVQAYSLGLAFGRRTLARYEGAFLRGYFGEEEVPAERIRLFELQALLDKWSSSQEARLGRRSRKPGAVLGDRAFDRLMRRSVAGVTNRLAAAP